VGVSVRQRPERFGVAKARWALRAVGTYGTHETYESDPLVS